MTGSTTPRDVFWTEPETSRRLLLLSRNPVAEAIRAVAEAAGLAVVLVEEDEDGRGVARYAELAPAAHDAVVLCDHDAPDADAVLRASLRSGAGYVAMMASRSRAAEVIARLEAAEVPGLEKLHMPAGLDIGGKSPGEIALSVVAEVVASSNGRSGGPMRAR